MRNFSSRMTLSFCHNMTSLILSQYDLKCLLRHSNPVYLTNSGTLNFLGTTIFGTKYISSALTGL
jgi:ABC-type cobalamin transport system ATPase subunit